MNQADGGRLTAMGASERQVTEKIQIAAVVMQALAGLCQLSYWVQASAVALWSTTLDGSSSDDEKPSGKECRRIISSVLSVDLCSCCDNIFVIVVAAACLQVADSEAP